MSAVAAIAIIEALIVTTGKLLDKMPNYSEKQKKRWFNMVRLYRIHVNLPKNKRCHDTIMNLRDEILEFNVIITKAADNG